jgi:hypothetical protein
MCHREPHLRGDLPLIVTVGDLRSPPVHGVDAGTIKDEMQIAASLRSSQGRKKESKRLIKQMVSLRE